MSVPINLQVAFGQAPADNLRLRGAPPGNQALGMRPAAVHAYRLASARSHQSGLVHAARQESSATLKSLLVMTAKQRSEARLLERGYAENADRPSLTDLLEEDLLRKHYKRVAKISGTFNTDPTAAYDQSASNRALDESIARMIKTGDPRVLDPAIQTLIANSGPLSAAYETAGLPQVPVHDLAGDVAAAIGAAVRIARSPAKPLRRSVRTRVQRALSPAAATESEADSASPPQQTVIRRANKSPLRVLKGTLAEARRRKPSTGPGL
jgi:hypothetical protein